MWWQWERDLNRERFTHNFCASMTMARERQQKAWWHFQQIHTHTNPLSRGSNKMLFYAGTKERFLLVFLALYLLCFIHFVFLDFSHTHTKKCHHKIFKLLQIFHFNVKFNFFINSTPNIVNLEMRIEKRIFLSH